MRILHVSDSHGMPRPAPKGGFDVVVCSGDFLPSCPGMGACPPKHLEQKYQQDWLRLNANGIAHYVGGRPFIWCAGNHDFIDPCDVLRTAGVDVYDANDREVTVEGVRWVGFPYVSFINGMMVNELNAVEMRVACARLVEGWDDPAEDGAPGVLIAHSPPYGVYDEAMDGNHYGNHVMKAMMEDRAAAKKPMPRLYLCGHIHRPASGQVWAGMRVYNSATKPTVIEYSG